ncbi:MAG: hypothetical protein CSA62_09135 [Planctomycetota bacterium]|nr:MAG: hypothetical protein CSA62_09135 [Planctomycetota bacterium]
MSRPLLVTIDVECDKGPDWSTATPLAFRGVVQGIGERLQPLFCQLAVRPTYLLSPEVLCDPESMALLRSLDSCELGTHLHGEYVAPHADFAASRTDEMQREYASELEYEKLATLSELFRQQTGRAARSFRAGRFGIGAESGRHLLDLGYLCDSSVTPHIQWTDRSGQRVPDFRGSGEQPYFVSGDGDLLRPGDSPLLELPVTIRAGAEAPRWLRPWYSSRRQLLALVDEIAEREFDTPLCMMFHNVELCAGTSPYPQSEDEVMAYLADLQIVLQHAIARGFMPMTMAQARQYYFERRGPGTGSASHPVWTHSESRRERGMRFSVEKVKQAVESAGTQPWHAYAYEERLSRWDLTEPYSWLCEQLPGDAPVLDVGCGIGSNLLYLAEQGFTDLEGFDLDASAIAAGRATAPEHGHSIELWTDSGLAPDAIPDKQYAAITSVNWTYLVDDFDFDSFLEEYARRLLPGGYLLVDAIDSAFNQHPKNRYLTSDWTKAEHERRPSEYKHRASRADVVTAAAGHGLQVVGEFRRQQEPPKACYVLQRPQSSRAVLYVVDSPGWAHDKKSRNLIRCLEPRFAGRVVYQEKLRAEDLDDADLVVLWYWRQLESLRDLGQALIRNRHKIAMGVCSHNELEGELRDRGLELLRWLPARVFTHSALLEQAVRPLLPGSESLCLPNGVDASFFVPRPEARRAGPLRIGWAGSLSNFGAEMRGVPNVIEPAMALLQEQFPGQFELVVAAREQRHRSPEEMRAFYQGLDVYVCASRVEGTPNPALEAAACGVPVVSTRVGNMPELIQHCINGLLIKRSPEALAAALRLLREREALRLQMGQRLRESIEGHWTWRERARGFAAMFEGLLREQACAPARQCEEAHA